MADLNAQQKQNGTRNWSVAQRNETALMLEDMYRGIAGDLKSVKKEILNEMKYASLQTGVLYQSIEKGNKDTYAVLKKELSEICANLKAQSDAAAAQIKAALKEGSCGDENAADRAVMEIKYLYSQNQGVYESLSSMLESLKTSEAETSENLISKADEMLAKIDEALSSLGEKVELLANGAEETDYDKVAETVKERVIEALPYEETDYEKIAETVAEKTETQAAAHSKEILDVLAALPAPENVDYNRIADEVGDKVLEKVTDLLGEKSEEKDEKAASAAYDRIVYGTAEKVIESLPPLERIDYARIAESNALTDEALAKIADAVAAKIVIPQPEEIDYEKLADTVIAKLPAQEAIDYDKLADAVIAKMPAAETIDYEELANTMLEKMPAPEAIDYEKIADTVIAKLPAQEEPDYEKLVNTVIERIPAAEEIDYEKLAEAAAAKIVIPEQEAIDYDLLADTVIGKMPATEEADYDKIADTVADTVIAKLPEAETIDYERLAYAVASKIEIPETEAIDYDKIANDVAAKIDIPAPEQMDYDRLASSVAERIPSPEPATYEVLVDEEGIKSIAETVSAAVAEKMTENAADAKAPEIDTGALAEEITEKMGTPTYETILDESGAQMIADAVAEKLQGMPVTVAAVATTEETKEEPEQAPAEEPVSEAEAEVAVAEDTAATAEDEYVTRWDRSFTAKLKQSDDDVKDRYGMIKNALLSYKKVKSSVSWNCDRFNCGRATVAKMNIRGKTLCVYFALDPADPQFKQTIYNQRDMGDQKAYEKTPFMMKIKSDLAAKRAVRLVEAMSDQCGTVKKKDFEEVDYKKTYRYAADRQLELTGLIKKTKGKKVAFDFD